MKGTTQTECATPHGSATNRKSGATPGGGMPNRKRGAPQSGGTPDRKRAAPPSASTTIRKPSTTHAHRHRHRHRRWALAFLAVLLAVAPAFAFLIAAPADLLANGGALRLANVVMGEYRVSVFTDPTPVRPDSLDVSVLVLQEGVEGVPDGLDVTVRTRFLEPRRGAAATDAREREGAPPVGTEQTRPATRAQADDPRYHAAKFALGAEGRWRVTVAVRGDAGEGEASFEVTARERGLLGHPVTFVLLALLPLVIAAWWILREEEDTGSEGAA